MASEADRDRDDPDAPRFPWQSAEAESQRPLFPWQHDTEAGPPSAPAEGPERASESVPAPQAETVAEPVAASDREVEAVSASEAEVGAEPVAEPDSEIPERSASGRLLSADERAEAREAVDRRREMGELSREEIDRLIREAATAEQEEGSEPRSFSWAENRRSVTTSALGLVLVVLVVLISRCDSGGGRAEPGGLERIDSAYGVHQVIDQPGPFAVLEVVDRESQVG
ncbi:hypothetical protein [Microbacterium gorillae]|uniref:hypothetical protein n=1 Tax=Microbacterium gorillae TaxID=1231063 RepID=UPI00058F928D|nr:hypothetical protein [Microbacterium gorillae]